MSAPALVAEPAWPELDGRPVVVLIDASNRLEVQLIEGWLERHAPADAHIETAEMPPSRRHQRHRGVSPVLRAMINRSDNPVLLPVRIAWLAEEHSGVRRVRIGDILMTGDPRDPDPLRARWLYSRYPERVRLVPGAPATVQELRAAWIEEGEGEDFGDFVAYRAWLALERGERAIRGNRYKVPKFVHQQITERADFQQEVIAIARDEGRPGEWGLKKASRYLREIAATHSPLMIDLMANLVHWLYRKTYGGIEYDRDELAQLYSLGQQAPVVFLPSHKSNFDHLVLHYVLWENDFPPNHTAGGINMNFFPVGPIVRRAGVFFIRRTFKDNELYKLVLKRYIDYLVERRFPLEWYMEGGRSRSGKLRAPRYGMLTYVADSFLRGKADEVYLLPIAITYDQVIDIGSYTAEQSGMGKDSESASWLVRTIRRLKLHSGDIHMRFGEPIALSKELDATLSGDARNLAIKKLAFEVGRRINDSIPFTPVSLVTIALLATPRTAQTFEEIAASVRGLNGFIAERGLPTTHIDAIDTDLEVRQVLDQLAMHGLLIRFDDGPEPVWMIKDDQFLAAAYYRNTVIHYFLACAISELALVTAGQTGEGTTKAFWDEVMRLRDLLKFEFYFPEKEAYRQKVDTELALRRADWQELLGQGPDGATAVLASMPLLSAQWALRPFFEAYRVVADVLATTGRGLEEKQVLAQAMALGKQYLLQNRIAAEESVSQVLFGIAYQLAQNRGLTHADTPQERLDEFAAEIQDVLKRIDVIASMAEQRRAGG